MLFTCCLLHIAVIILKHILYLIYLRPCLGLVLFMLHLCDPFFIFSLLFIIINHIASLKQAHLIFTRFSEDYTLVLDDGMNEERLEFSNS